MKQSRAWSLFEQIASTVIGLVVALPTQLIVFPWFGFNPPLSQNLMITAIFTVVSIVRGYGIRRLFEALHIHRPLSPFMQAVIAERYRQIEVEGFDLAHDDDAHVTGELARAGAGYASDALMIHRNGSVPRCWPWGREWYKPRDFRRDLVRAAALILAEGERFDRLRRVGKLDDVEVEIPASISLLKPNPK